MKPLFTAKREDMSGIYKFTCGAPQDPHGCPGVLGYAGDLRAVLSGRLKDIGDFYYPDREGEMITPPARRSLVRRP